MRLISPSGSRLIVTWDPDKISPQNGYTIHMMFPALAAKYGFVAAPNSFQAQQALFGAQIASKATAGQYVPPMANFIGGQAAIDGVVYPIFQLDFALGTHTFVLACQHSEACDKVLGDMAQFLERTFGAQNIANHCTRRFVSGITVEFDQEIDKRLDGLRKISSLINKTMDQEGIRSEYHFEQLAFSRDPGSITREEALSVANVIIERRMGRSHSENRYHCVGPLRTEKLIELMREIELAIS